MARGVWKDTPERIRAARERLPLSLGPWLGEMCMQYNVSAGMVATLVGCHEQTVFRWFFGQSEINVQWLKPLMKLMCLLSWMHSINSEPLVGSVKERHAQLDRIAREFGTLSKRAA